MHSDISFFESSWHNLVFESVSTDKQEAIREFSKSHVYNTNPDILYTLEQCEYGNTWSFYAIEYLRNGKKYAHTKSYQL